MIAFIRLLPYVLAAAAIAAVLTFAYQQGAKSERLNWMQKEEHERIQMNDAAELALKSVNDEKERQQVALANVINELVTTNEKLNSDIAASRTRGLYIDRKAVCAGRLSPEITITGGTGEELGTADKIRLPESLERELRADYEAAAKLASDCRVLLDYAKGEFIIE
jgi:hypothetical protein